MFSCMLVGLCVIQSVNRITENVDECSQNFL